MNTARAHVIPAAPPMIARRTFATRARTAARPCAAWARTLSPVPPAAEESTDMRSESITVARDDEELSEEPLRFAAQTAAEGRDGRYGSEVACSQARRCCQLVGCLGVTLDLGLI